jgi:hypothetical protein
VRKNPGKEGCKTKQQENVTLNKAYDDYGEPEHRESQPQVKRKNFLGPGDHIDQVTVLSQPRAPGLN